MLLKATTFKFILLAAFLGIAARDGIAQTTARDYCNRGAARQTKGDLDGALADYNRAIEIDPHDAAPYNNRGLAKAAKGDLDGALADYDRALQISPRNFEIRDNRGVVRQKKGDLDGALADYDIAIKLWRKYVPAYSHRASIEIAKNDLDRALADCNYAIYLNPKDAAAYNNRALIKTAKGELDAAAEDFNRASKLDPKYARNRIPAVNKAKVEATVASDEHHSIEPNAKNLDADKNRDLAAQKKDDLNGPRPKPDDATPIEIEPENIAAVYDRNVAKQKNDDHTGAVADHKPAPALATKTVDLPSTGDVDKNTRMSVASAQPSLTAELPSKNVEAPKGLELAKPSTDGLGGGIAEARGLEVPNSLALPVTADVSNQNHDLNVVPPDQRGPAEQTVTNLPEKVDAAKQSKPDSNVALADLSHGAEPKNLNPLEEATAATQKGSLSGTSADHYRATEPDPTTAAGYDKRAQFRKTIGDSDGALADYNRAIQLDPKYAAAYNGRGNIKRAKRDLDGALADYSRAIELNGGNSSAYYNRGVTKQTKGDLDGALADFNPAIQLDPKNSAAYHSRGATKAMKGDSDGALADYNRAIELEPKDAVTYNNRADLFFSSRKWDAALENYSQFFELSKEGQEYPRLYVWLIRARTGQTDAANKELVDYLQRRGNSADWVSTVASHLLGQISGDDLLSAAKSPDKKKENGQLCEAWFYVGMKKLIGGDKTGAQTCFTKSLATNQKDYTEYQFARSELKALRN